MRAFVALELPAASRALLRGVAQRLAALGDVRATALDQLHITLQFLGDVDAREAEAMARWVHATAVAAPRLRLGPLGQFPPRGAPRVLWAGLTGDVAAVDALAAAAGQAASTAGVATERRPFHAHITLGRCRTPRGATQLQTAVRAPDAELAAESLIPTALVLYRSELGRTGSVYTELARVELLPAVDGPVT